MTRCVHNAFFKIEYVGESTENTAINKQRRKSPIYHLIGNNLTLSCPQVHTRIPQNTPKSQRFTKFPRKNKPPTKTIHIEKGLDG